MYITEFKTGINCYTWSDIMIMQNKTDRCKSCNLPAEHVCICSPRKKIKILSCESVLCNYVKQSIVVVLSTAASSWWQKWILTDLNECTYTN